MNPLSPQTKKLLQALLALVMLPLLFVSQRGLERQRTELGVMMPAELQNAPPLLAFVTACHEGLLQKFAIPGIPDWMAFMSSVTLMLRVLGVLSDEPPSFPISKKFASAFALSALRAGAVSMSVVRSG